MVQAIRTITFEVPGQPVPQPRPRVSTIGGRGRAYVPAKHAIHSYRQAVQLVATTSGWEAGPTDDSLAVWVDWYFERPKSHYTAKGLSKRARKRPRGDADNLLKGVLDAITDSGAFWVDDDQVVETHTSKRYAAEARTIITVGRLDE